MCMADLQWARRLARRRLAAPDPAAPARPAGRARLERAGRHRARVHRLPRHLRGGVAQGLPRPRARQPLQRRLLDARDRAAGAAARAASAARWPPPTCRSRTRRASATSASTRSTSATPTRSSAVRQPRDLQERRQGDRRPGGHVDHLHGQVRRARGQLVPHPPARCARDDDSPVFADDQRGVRALPRRPARLPARADAVLRAEHQLVQALPEGSFAPTAVAWGHDNRTCAMRVVGHGPALRIENRVPGGDVNPYLALAAMIAAGLHGVDAGLELEPILEGNAYTADKPHVPSTLREARDLFAASTVAREAFGEEVVAHYLNNADVELDGVRRRGHGLGALPGVRAAVSAGRSACRPALERARWGPLGRRRPTCSRARTPTRCRRAGGHRRAPAARPDAGEDPEPWLDLLDGADHHRRGRRRSRVVRCRAASADARDGARARRVRDRAGARGDGARPAAARRLPRHAGDERRPRRDADPAPARRRRPRGPPPRAGRRSTTPTTTCGWPTARWPRRVAGEAIHSTKSHHHQGVDRGRRGPGGHGLGDDRRSAGDDRGPDVPVRARRAVAPGGGRATRS